MVSTPAWHASRSGFDPRTRGQYLETFVRLTYGSGSGYVVGCQLANGLDLDMDTPSVLARIWILSKKRSYWNFLGSYLQKRGVILPRRKLRECISNARIICPNSRNHLVNRRFRTLKFNRRDRTFINTIKEHTYSLRHVLMQL